MIQYSCLNTLELVPAVMGDFYLLGLPKDSSGCEAGSYLQWVETSLSAFLVLRQSKLKGGERDGSHRFHSLCCLVLLGHRHLHETRADRNHSH